MELIRPGDPDLLSGLSEIELQALSEGVLSVEHQDRLSALLERNRDQALTDDEAAELDRYLEQIDSLNILTHTATLTANAADHLRRYAPDEQATIGPAETALAPTWI